MDQKQSGPVTANRAATKPHLSQANDTAHRRIALHHALVRRRRWSAELDEICGVNHDRLEWPEPYIGDYWHDIGADLTVAELAAAGEGWWPS